MASEELKSSSPPETDEHPESCVTDPDPEGHYEPEDREIVGEVDSVECKGTVANPTHPLEHSWTFWFDNPSAKSKRVAWGASIRPMYTFSTVEEFWSLYNNIHHPSKLAVGADFYCFKNKIEPKWEDPVCANGGKWTVNFNRGESDTCWLYSLLAMIGEQFYHGDEICGVVVNVRGRQEKISLWTKNASNESAMFLEKRNKKIPSPFNLFTVRGSVQREFEPIRILLNPVSIGKQWKELLDHNETIGFIFHDDAEKFGKSAKNRYTV